MKKILILGIEGFIGSSISTAMTKMGNQVIGITRKRRDTNGNELIHSSDQVIENPKIIPSDLDVIYVATRPDSTKNSSVATISLLNALQGKTSRLVNLSSYIQHYSIPNGSTLDQYRHAKIQVSRHLENTWREARWIDLSLFTVIGELDRHDSFFQQFLRKQLRGETVLATKGDQLISYTDVEDLIRCLIQLDTEWNHLGKTAYSFWPSPPKHLKEYIYETSKFLGTEQKVILGGIELGGHELLTYDSAKFPPMIFEDFCWTPFLETVSRIVDYIRSNSPHKRGHRNDK